MRGAYGCIRNPCRMRLAYKLDTMRMHDGSLADVGPRRGLLPGGDLPPHEPRGGVAGRQPALRRLHQHDRAALDRDHKRAGRLVLLAIR